MNERERKPASFLLADCGSVTTTAALFDVVEGSYRLIAKATSPTTIVAPWHDILIGVQHAVHQIAEITGRSLITGEGDLVIPEQQNGAGVDYFGVTFSAARPLTVIVAGLLEDVSVASARRALETIYATELRSFTLDSVHSEQEQIQAILESKPELLFIAGGTDESDSKKLLQLLESLELGAGLLNGATRPEILYAGSSRLRQRVTEAFGTTSTVHIADNVRPSIDSEQLHDATRLLGDIYLERKIRQLPGIQGLAGTTNLPIQTTARGFAAMIEYFGALYRSRVLGVDLGSSSITIAAANDHDPGRLYTESELGLGQSLPGLLNRVELEEVLQWVPEDYDKSSLKDLIFNKAVHPHSVPFSEKDVHLEQALARVLLRQAFVRAAQSWGWSNTASLLPSPSLIILRGNPLAASPRPGQALLTVLDALQATGVYSVAVDRYGVLPLLGQLAKQDPAAVVQILEGGVLFELGWVIAPAGAGNPGERALHINVESEDKGEYRIDAEFGELISVPLAPGASARLTLKPEGKVDVGRGAGRARKITVHGGAVGLVVDVRGRPLQLPADGEERRGKVRQWYWDMGS